MLITPAAHLQKKKKRESTRIVKRKAAGVIKDSVLFGGLTLTEAAQGLRRSRNAASVPSSVLQTGQEPLVQSPGA